MKKALWNLSREAGIRDIDGETQESLKRSIIVGMRSRFGEKLTQHMGRIK